MDGYRDENEMKIVSDLIGLALHNFFYRLQWRRENPGAKASEFRSYSLADWKQWKQEVTMLQLVGEPEVPRDAGIQELVAA